MKKIIQREITNEDGDAYGVVGDITRLGAYRAIRQDLRSYGIEDDIEFKAEDLERVEFWETPEAEGDYADYIWWGKPKKSFKPKSLGKGWIYRVY